MRTSTLHDSSLMAVEKSPRRWAQPKGDPLSMAFYALSTVPLISTFQTDHPDVRQIWYADDSGGGGRLWQLRSWWDTINGTGQSFGYDVNRPKTILLVKPDVVEVAKELFIDTAVRITTDGAPYLGSAVGEHAFREAFLRTKVDMWCKELECLAGFAQSEPQAAYACSPDPWTSWALELPPENNGWNGESGWTPDRSIRHVLLPQLTGQGAVQEEDIPLLYLPARLGGIGLPCLALVAAEEHKASVEITRAQVNEILWKNDQARQPPQCVSVHNGAQATRAEIRTARRKSQNDRQMVLRSSTPARSHQVELLAGKGCSAWLTALPLWEHGFALNKQEFRDALAFRYRWEIPGTPESVCAERPSPPTMLWSPLMEGFPPCDITSYAISLVNSWLRCATTYALNPASPIVEQRSVLLPICQHCSWRPCRCASKRLLDARRGRLLWRPSFSYERTIVRGLLASQPLQPSRALQETWIRGADCEHRARIIHPGGSGHDRSLWSGGWLFHQAASRSACRTWSAALLHCCRLAPDPDRLRTGA